MNRPYGRPAHHPDFEVLSEAVMSVDALSTSGAMTVLDLVKEVADPDTAVHFALQRAMRIAKLMGLSQDKVVMLGGLWLDGMLAGYKLRQAHEQK